MAYWVSNYHGLSFPTRELLYLVFSENLRLMSKNILSIASALHTITRVGFRPGLQDKVWSFLSLDTLYFPFILL